MKIPNIKWKLPVVRRRDYDELERSLRMVNRALETALKKRRQLEREKDGLIADRIRYEKALIQAKAAVLEEQGRADHFQKRCEAYEDAASKCWLEFRYLAGEYCLCVKGARSGGFRKFIAVPEEYI